MPDITEDTLVFVGDSIKAERVDEGVKLGGYLVRYGGQDLSGEFFDRDTDYDIDEYPAKVTTYFNHGYDPLLGKRKFGKATLTSDDIGIWAEQILKERDEYERFIANLAFEGKLAWSSGTAPHLMDRKRAEDGRIKITIWPLVEASMTHTPAEPRNTLIPIKSLIHHPDPVKQEPDTSSIKEDNMTEEKATVETPQVDIEALFKKFEESQAKAIEEAVKSALDKEEPQVKGGVAVEVIGDEADRALKGNPFKSGGEFLQSVWRADTNQGVDKRLLPLKATGANEAIPSEGGFLVTEQIADGIEQNMWEVGNVLSRFSPIPISVGNGLTLKAIDETSRATGSRMGGLQAYWLGEAQQATSSKPKFRNIELKLKKIAALCYATDELLADASALEGWLASEVPQELRFMVEDSFIDGDGVGKPLGILQSGALISATRADQNKVADEDISGMWSRRMLGPQDYVWFVNATVMPQLYAMTVGDAPIFLPPGGFRDSPYGMLFGRPVIETEYNPYLGTVGDILLAAPSQYIAITKGGMQAASSIHVKFDYFETAFRFVYRVDGQPKLASSITAFDGTNTVSPFVALAATT